MQKINIPTPNSQFPTPAHGGFTLVETLVATGIITVVMLSAIGAVMTIQDANRKTQAVRAVIDNLNGALDNMTRKIRTGNTYHCGDSGISTVVISSTETAVIFASQDCPQHGSGYWDTTFAFVSADDVETGDAGSPLVYSLRCVPPSAGIDRTDAPISDTGVCATGKRGTIMYYNPAQGSEYLPLIDPKIDIKQLRFYAHNAEHSNQQSSVLITIKGVVLIEKNNTETPFNIQTTVSQYLK